MTDLVRSYRHLKGNVTLVYATRDSEHNNARVLEELVAQRMRGLSVV